MTAIDAPTAANFPRREFLAKGSATIAFLAAFQLGSDRAKAQGLGFDPFSYGVASGDPLPDRVIIWTCVNPSAAATPGSGLGAPVRGIWVVSRHATFTQLVATGRFVTQAATNHTVKVDLPNWMITSLDREAKRVGVTRQSIIQPLGALLFP